MRRNQCVKCGNPLPTTDRFCTKCSYAVKPEELSYSSRKILRWIGYVGISFVVLIFIGLLILQSQKTQTPAEPVIYATSTPVPPTSSPIPTSTPTEAEQRNISILQKEMATAVAGEIRAREKKARATALAEGKIVPISSIPQSAPQSPPTPIPTTISISERTAKPNNRSGCQFLPCYTNEEEDSQDVYVQKVGKIMDDLISEINSFEMKLNSGSDWIDSESELSNREHEVSSFQSSLGRMQSSLESLRVPTSDDHESFHRSINRCLDAQIEASKSISSYYSHLDLGIEFLAEVAIRTSGHDLDRAHAQCSSIELDYAFLE